jgi:hypothetical protein
MTNAIYSDPAPPRLAEPLFRPRPSETRRDRDLPLIVPESGNLFRRLVTTSAVSSVSRRSPAEVAKSLWPSDELVQRAVSAPAMTGVVGWSAELAHKLVFDALEGLGPSAAGAQLLLQSLVLAWDGYGLISAPGFVAGAGSAGFVAEGAPIPVKQLLSAAVTLAPFKLAAISVLTRTMIDSSNAEQLVGDTLMRSAALALDAQLLGSAAATAAAPAGLRNGISASTPSASTDEMGAFYEDCHTLLDAVSTVGGNGPFVLVGSPGRIATMVMRFVLQPGNVSVLAANAMGNDLLCVAPNAIVCALSPNPVIETATAGELHMEGSTPAAIVNGGAPAAPARSLFQTDSVALKMRWPVSWALRDARAVAWLTPTAWK